MDTTMNHGMCRCCASEGTFKNLSNAYQWMGQEEIYSDMLKECFDISLTTAEPGEEGGICEVCITQLRNAANFKKQVQHTEVQFKKCLQDKLFKSDLIKVEATNLDDGDDSDNDNNLSDNFSGNEFDMAIKKEKEDPKPKKRVATRASTSRAKKSKVDDGEPSTKRNHPQTFKIKVEVEEVNSNQDITDISTFKEDSTTVVDNTRVNDEKCIHKMAGTSSTVKRNKKENIRKRTKYVDDAATKQKYFNNIKAILENSNATVIRHRGGIGYACGYCTKQYPDAADLKKHSLEAHDDVHLCYFAKTNRLSISKCVIKLDITSLCCKLCNTSIKTLECLMEHFSKTHDVKIFTDINNHIIPFKFETKFLSCAICENGVAFHKFKSLLEHMTVHYRNYVCEECDAGFINHIQLRNHKAIHESGNYTCETCAKVFNNGNKFKAHVRAVHVRKQQALSKCGYCKESFLYFHTKEKHLQEVHGVNIVRIKCQACDRSFLSRSNYTKHMKLNHLMVRPHSCGQCDKSFAYLAALKEHEGRVHLGLRMHKCDECIKTFSTKKSLQQHVRIHNNDRRFKCSLCGQAFIAKISWRGHMRSKHGMMI
ncbi:zinc finger protein 92-like isoform X3 [Achroia grisella]|uniref:zinc finger protein 92-like isoform X3 n=1 Tax=Achroia grisella TaxID=688607 RepID=UPI0027D1FD59|nr:zinc finger protein 92-like isoform X3 [Achroia grisella]